MRVTVRLFALQREQLGRRSVELDLPAGSSIADAWRALVETHPVLAPAGSVVRFARNGVYAPPAEQLEDADEVAVIPPVAGGDATRSGSPGRVVALAESLDDADVARLSREIATEADGALVAFVGRTRVTPGTPAPGQEDQAARHAGERVVALDYEAYETMALATLHAIADEIRDRFAVDRLAIVHRTGTVPVGDPSVVVVAAAPHREAAFGACRYAIDELKARAPIWKAERFEGGSVWLGTPARTAPR